MVLMLDASSKKSYPGSGQVWYDLSGYNNHAALEGAIFSSENNGIIKTVDASNPIVINDHPSLKFTDEFTLCIWVKFYSIANEETGFQTIFGKPAYYNYGIIAEWYSSNNELLADFTDELGFRNGIGLLYPSLTDWNFIAFSYKKNGGINNLAFHLWKSENVESVYGTVAENTRVLTNEEPLHISDYDFNINIGTAYAYNRALSFAEIQQNFNSMRSRFQI